MKKKQNSPIVVGPDVPDIYPLPGWVWQYPVPKQAILRFAQPIFLSIVELFHYALFLTQTGVAYALYKYPPEAQVASMFLLIMAPIFQMLAGFSPIVMHEYEGWQIAPFEDQPTDRAMFNNQRLREVAYKLLFAYQTIAAIMFVVGVFGIEKWDFRVFSIVAPWPLIIVVLAILWVHISPRVPRSTFITPKFLGGGQPVFPIPWGILVVFGIAIFFYIIAMIHVYGLYPALLTILFLTLGGLVEGLIAESTFNQFWHWLAFVFLGSAGIVQIVTLIQLS
ncbi:MAG: hypothetical protein AB4062_21195 [Crocosphaera sp.]